MEGHNFDIRKHLVEYDDVLNKQREIIYKKRKKVLEAGQNEELRNEISEKIKNAITGIVMVNSTVYEGAAQKTAEEFSTIIPFDEQSVKQIAKQLEQYSSHEQKIEFLNNVATDLYKKREENLGNLIRQVEKFVMLSVIDKLWMDHLDVIENLRQGIGLRGYGQKDPLVEYKNEAFTMFEKLIGTIDDEVVHTIYKIQVQSSVPHEHIPQNQVENIPAEEVSSSKPVQNSNKKPGRNDPCWCGSGKKYKKCHYPN